MNHDNPRPEYNEVAIQQALDALDWTGYPKDFPRQVANKKSWESRRLVEGVGINDAPYHTTPRVDGVRQWCPIYRAWQNMLVRCYNARSHVFAPTYAVCTVSPEWHTFSRFRAWVLAQPNWYGRALDSDLLVPGGTIYGPSTCLMIPQSVNNLFPSGKQRRPEQAGCPTGVTRRPSGRYAASSPTKQSQNLGTYDTPEEAASVYRNAKLHRCLTVAHQYLDEPLLFAAIIDNLARVYAPKQYH